ncbi:FtsX-like permease family protein [Zunongwangia sp. F363]|uniref:FtsX-like permease family protein n=1 Tax=Autumnicola tepida TaxID=3075595 RepID=A0ABU3CDX8_9FLAO|nr:FtsX-like permease family protein [Zunongwangia sp. F363]MDT0644540.1 FtsX-like permease family protein [Zunongwangia sp. F363]
MIRNYFKIAWRTIQKNKLFSAINILSLAIGLSTSFVIGLMVYYEFSFDNFHPDKEKIYRVVTNFERPEGNDVNRGVSKPLKKTMNNISGVETASLFLTYEPLKISTGENDKIYNNPENVIFTDENYFKIFQYKWLAGNKNDALKAPNEIVITKERADKYFPGINAQEIIGKTLVYNDSINTKIKGIVSEFRKNTDIIFQEFISLPTAKQSYLRETLADDSWHSTNSASQLFLKINSNSGRKNIQQQLDKISLEYSSKESLREGRKRTFQLQALKELHFSEKYGIFDYGHDAASKKVLLSLGAVAMFLLLLGSINFINLSTSQATQRAKEIGIRKTMGSSRKQLIFQFLSETFLLTLIAGLCSVIIGILLLKIFNEFIPESLNYQLFFKPEIILGIAGILVLISLLSGIYPALILSNFSTTSVLRNKTGTGNNISIRRYLTVFQFTIAQVLVIMTLLVSKQLHYALSKDMGFKTSAIAFVRTPWKENDFNKKLRLENSLKNDPKISKISLGGSPPASTSLHSTGISFFKNEQEIKIPLELIYGDPDYLDLYNINLLAGRKPLNDTIQEYVVNETFMHRVGYKSPENLINKNLVKNGKNYVIVGVMPDFNQRSLKSTIHPMAFVPDYSRETVSQFNTVHFLFNETTDLSETISDIENKWKSIYPDSDFEIRFMDQTIANFYEKERSTRKLLAWATGLAILISILGLLGLVIYSTEKRAKEIGIRKVLGASIAKLNFLLCRDFIVPIAIAYLIALPSAIWGIRIWLQDFAYKATMSWWIFALSGIGMVLIALIVVSVKTVSTAMKNPVKTLKIE